MHLWNKTRWSRKQWHSSTGLTMQKKTRQHQKQVCEKNCKWNKTSLKQKKQQCYSPFPTMQTKQHQKQSYEKFCIITNLKQNTRIWLPISDAAKKEATWWDQRHCLEKLAHDRTKQIQKKLQRAQSSQNMDRVKTMIIEAEDKNQRLNERRRKTNLLGIASLDALQINDRGSVASGDFGVYSLEKLWSPLLTRW